MNKLIICLLLFCGGIQAQSKKDTLALGITCTITEKYFNVVCANPAKSSQILQQDVKDQKLVRYAVTFKVDRLGRYPEYRFTYKLEDADYATSLVKSLK